MKKATILAKVRHNPGAVITSTWGAGEARQIASSIRAYGFATGIFLGNAGQLVIKAMLAEDYYNEYCNSEGFNIASD